MTLKSDLLLGYANMGHLPPVVPAMITVSIRMTNMILTRLEDKLQGERWLDGGNEAFGADPFSRASAIICCSGIVGGFCSNPLHISL